MPFGRWPGVSAGRWARSIGAGGHVGTDRICPGSSGRSFSEILPVSKMAEWPEPIKDGRLAVPTTRHEACSTRISRLGGPGKF